MDLQDMRHRGLTLLVALLPALWGMTVSATEITHDMVGKALDELDSVLRHRDEYVSRAELQIDSVKELRASDKANSRVWFDHTMDIAWRYRALNNDSMLYYLKQGVDAARVAGQDSLVAAFDIRYHAYLALYGYIDDAVSGYERYDAGNLPAGLMALYHDAGKQLYSYVAAFYENDSDMSMYWSDKSEQSQLELLEVLDEKSEAYRLNRGESLLLAGYYEQARRVLEALIADLSPDSNNYARACYFLADISKHEGDHEGQLYYLARSASSDAVAATLEVTALQELGQLLYRDNDIDRAYAYLSMALTNAVECNAILRQIQTSRSLPVIQKANESLDNQWRTLVYVIITVLAVLVFVLVGTLLFLRRQMRRMKVMQITLRRANKTREVYINQFMALCTIYIEKLKHYNDLVNRKLSAGQADELYKSTKTGKFIEEQVHEFYEVFDDAFLHIYPTFVTDINALLQPDRQIVLREGERLNTDLRILAFMRLGIEDAARVAQILNYSVNTIYAYRNKLRNRAISRETFERDIMRTGVV